MRNTKSIFILIAILTFAGFGYSQSMLSGKVVQVLDGKTVVIEISSGKITAEMQYIEVPESEQEMHSTVKEHLEKLVLNKDVVFRSAGLGWGRTFGQLYVNSSDIALQMLRDGAAWHVDPAKSGQRPGDGEAYEHNQAQAKIENRGVWGVKGMKPAWQFRADKVDADRQARVAAERAAAQEAEAKFEPASAVKKPVRRSGPWGDTNPFMKDPGPLMHGYNAATKMGYLGTSLLGVKELETIPSGQKVAMDVTYMYKQESDKVRKGTFTFTLISVADEWRFLKANSVSLIVDEKTIVVGKPKRTTTKEDGKAIEKLSYEVTKATIEKIVYGGDVVIKIGDYSMYPGQGLQLLLYNMLQVAE